KGSRPGRDACSGASSTAAGRAGTACAAAVSRAWTVGPASAASRTRMESVFIGAPSCKATVGCQLKRRPRGPVDLNPAFSKRDAAGGQPAHGLHQQRMLALEYAGGERCGVV